MHLIKILRVINFMKSISCLVIEDRGMGYWRMGYVVLALCIKRLQRTKEDAKVIYRDSNKTW